MRFVVEFDVVVPLFEHLDEFARRRVILVGRQDVHIGFRARAADERVNRVIRLRRVGETRAVVFRTVVATDAELLNDAVIKVEFERQRTSRAEVFLDFARFASRRFGQDGRGRVELRLVATVAANVFARHPDEPAAEELNRGAVFVDRKNRQRRVRRNLEERAAVLFDRNVTEEALNVPAALDADRLVPAGAQVSEVVGENFQSGDFAARNVFRAETVVNVGDEDGRFFFAFDDAVREGRREVAFDERRREEEAFFFDDGDRRHVVERVDEVKAVSSGRAGDFAVDENVVLAKRIREDEVVFQAGRLHVEDVPFDVATVARDFANEAGFFGREDSRVNVELGVFRAPFLRRRVEAERIFAGDRRVDDEKTPDVAATVVAGADADDFRRIREFASVFERGREERAGAVKFRLVRAVRVHVEQDAAVIVHDVAIFPTQIHNASVFQRRRVPVGVLLEGELARFLRFRVDGVDVRHRVGAVDAGEPLLAGVRAGDHLPFRRVAGVEEVDVRLVGRRERFQVLSFDVDFEDGPTFVVVGNGGEHNAVPVPVEFRFENRRAVRRFVNRRERRLFGAQIGENAEFAVPAALRDFVDRHEVVADRRETVRTDDEKFEVVERRIFEERFATERGELRFPSGVFRLRFFEFGEFREVFFAVRVIVGKLRDHIVDRAANRFDRVDGAVVVVPRELLRRDGRDRTERQENRERKRAEGAFHRNCPY